MNFDWDFIKDRWEHGETAGQIAKTPGMPTRQAINKRARKEGWERKLEQFPVATTGTSVSIPLDLDPRKKSALGVLSQGGNYKDAARAACISEETFRLWRKDPEYLELVLAVETGLKLEMLEHVRQGAARDPKHAQWWLQHHPQTRSEFGHGATTPTVGNQYNVLAGNNLGIDRSNVIEVEASCEAEGG